MIGTGTVVNVAAVLAGGALGLLLGARLPARMRRTIVDGLGLVVIAIGVRLSLETAEVLVVLGSLLLGGVVGELLHVEERLDRLGRRIEQRTSRTGPAPAEEAPDGPSRFSCAFLTASLVFCVGPMTILGSFQDGLRGDHELLVLKSALDFFAALAFASTMGPGVIASALTVLVYQATLTLGARWVSGVLTDPMVTEMTATGGVLMMAIGLGLLEIKRVRTGNLLPAIGVAPVIVAVVGWLSGAKT